MVDISLIRRITTAATSIAAPLKHLITSGEVPVGSKLPSERELAVSLSVSRATLRANLDQHGKYWPSSSKSGGSSALGIAAHSFSDHQLKWRYSETFDLLTGANEQRRLAESLELDMESDLFVAQAAQNLLMFEICSLTSEWTLEERRHTHVGWAGRRLSMTATADLRCRYSSMTPVRPAKP